MPRYIFSNGEIAVEEGVYAPFKKAERQPTTRGVWLLAPHVLEPHEPSESTSKDKEHPDDKE